MSVIVWLLMYRSSLSQPAVVVFPTKKSCEIASAYILKSDGIHATCQEVKP